MPPESAQPDFFYDTFCTFYQASVERRSCVFSGSGPCSRVTCALLKPLMPGLLICGNSYSALKQEPLYNFHLHLGLDNSAPCPMRSFCIAAIGIGSPIAANLSPT